MYLTLPSKGITVGIDRPVIVSERVDALLTDEVVARILAEVQGFAPEWNDAREFAGNLIAGLVESADTATRAGLVRLLQSA